MTDPALGHIDVILFICVALFIGVVIRVLYRHYNIPLPYTVTLIVVGILLSLLERRYSSGNMFVVAMTEMSHMGPHAFLYILMPGLLFESALNTHFHILTRTFWSSVLLAGPGVVLNTVFMAILAVFIFPYGWDWKTGILFGAILSPTDTVAVVSLLRELGASKKLSTLIEAESLFNDGSAFVIFSVFLDLTAGKQSTGVEIVVTFVRTAVGGVAFGVLCGMVAVILLEKIFDDSEVEIMVTLAGAYLVFWLSDAVLGVSGFLSTVVYGIWISKNIFAIGKKNNLDHVWGMISFTANTLIFVISGVIGAEKMGADPESEIRINWSYFGYLLLAYVWLHLARTIVVVVSVPLIRLSGVPVDWREVIVLIYTALRGAVALICGLIVQLTPGIPVKTQSLIIFFASGITLLTCLVNGSTGKKVVASLGLHLGTPVAQLVQGQAMVHLMKQKEVYLTRLQTHSDCIKWSEVLKVNRDFMGTLPKATEMQNRTVRQTGGRGLQDLDTKEAAEELGDEFNSPDGKQELLDEFRMRFLACLKVEFVRQHSAGVLSLKGLYTILHAVEEAEVLSDFEIMWQTVASKFKIPKKIRWLYVSKLRCCSKFARKLMFRQLIHQCELATAYATAASAVQVTLAKSFPELVDLDPTVLLQVYKELEREQKIAVIARLDVRVAYPEAFSAFQTRRAVKQMLQFQDAQARRLLDTGLIDDGEHARMTRSLQRELYWIDKRPWAGELNPPTPAKAHIVFCRFPVAQQERVNDSGEIRLIRQGKVIKPYDDVRTCCGLITRQALSGRQGVLVVIRGMVITAYDPSETASPFTHLFKGKVLPPGMASAGVGGQGGEGTLSLMPPSRQMSMTAGHSLTNEMTSLLNSKFAQVTVIQKSGAGVPVGVYGALTSRSLSFSMSATMLEGVYLPDRVVKQLMEDPETSSVMWKYAAIELAVSKFLDDFRWLVLGQLGAGSGEVEGFWAQLDAYTKYVERSGLTGIIDKKKIKKMLMDTKKQKKKTRTAERKARRKHGSTPKGDEHDDSGREDTDVELSGLDDDGDDDEPADAASTLHSIWTVHFINKLFETATLISHKTWAKHKSRYGDLLEGRGVSMDAQDFYFSPRAKSQSKEGAKDPLKGTKTIHPQGSSPVILLKPRNRMLIVSGTVSVTLRAQAEHAQRTRADGEGQRERRNDSYERDVDGDDAEIELTALRRTGQLCGTVNGDQRVSTDEVGSEAVKTEERAQDDHNHHGTVAGTDEVDGTKQPNVAVHIRPLTIDVKTDEEDLDNNNKKQHDLRRRRTSSVSELEALVQSPPEDAGAPKHQPVQQQGNHLGSTSTTNGGLLGSGNNSRLTTTRTPTVAFTTYSAPLIFPKLEAPQISEADLTVPVENDEAAAEGRLSRVGAEDDAMDGTRALGYDRAVSERTFGTKGRPDRFNSERILRRKYEIISGAAGAEPVDLVGFEDVTSLTKPPHPTLDTEKSKSEKKPNAKAIPAKLIALRQALSRAAVADAAKLSTDVYEVRLSSPDAIILVWDREMEVEAASSLPPKGN